MITNTKICIAEEGDTPTRESFALIVFSDHLFYGFSKGTPSTTAKLADRPLSTNLDLAKSVIGRFTLDRDTSEV